MLLLAMGWEVDAANGQPTECIIMCISAARFFLSFFFVCDFVDAHSSLKFEARQPCLTTNHHFFNFYLLHF
jgi:hypothetical protein